MQVAAAVLAFGFCCSDNYSVRKKNIRDYQKMDITIDKSVALNDVYAYSGLAGQREGDLDAVMATEDDESLEGMTKEAISEAEELLGEWGAVKKSQTPNQVIFSLSLPPNWDESMKPMLVENLRQYLTYAVLVKWYGEVRKEDKLPYYISVKSGIAERIRKILCKRNKPLRQ